jgi:hypothetical protein
MTDLLADIMKNSKQPKPPQFTPQDVLAAIGFEAQRIANSVAQHSAGAPMVDPKAMQVVIDRMSELNASLIHVVSVAERAHMANQNNAVGIVKLPSN